MPDLARNSADSKRLATPPRIFPAGLGRPLPARLADLNPLAHARVGVLLDDKRVRLVLGDHGEIVVVRRVPT
jgi:hypothetical protein